MTSSWPTQEHLDNHWHWRPEWLPERVCLYWYLTFGDELADGVLDPVDLAAMRRAEWLDAVPASWLHITLCDVGFTDELTPRDIERVVESGRSCVAEARSLNLSFGQAACMEDAIALPVEPLEPLRHLQQRLCSATDQACRRSADRVHRHPYWPHLSIGYANRRTPAESVVPLLSSMGRASGEVMVDRLVLAAVNRDRRYYEWTVIEELPLGRASMIA